MKLQTERNRLLNSIWKSFDVEKPETGKLVYYIDADGWQGEATFSGCCGWRDSFGHCIMPDVKRWRYSDG
jgi:hypothetical protein